jgi:hypothetical protein
MPFRYVVYDWNREMPKFKRVVTMAGILIQGFAIYAGFTRSLIWPAIWPRGVVLFPSCFCSITSATAFKTRWWRQDSSAARCARHQFFAVDGPCSSSYRKENDLNRCKNLIGCPPNSPPPWLRRHGRLKSVKSTASRQNYRVLLATPPL